jgi:hypothetical protein
MKEKIRLWAQTVAQNVQRKFIVMLQWIETQMRLNFMTHAQIRTANASVKHIIHARFVVICTHTIKTATE